MGKRGAGHRRCDRSVVPGAVEEWGKASIIARVAKENNVHKTYMAKKEDAGITFTRQWFVVDATGQPLGRLASQLALILQGKHKPSYTPHFDVGDYVVVINADKILLTGKKWDQKMWYSHSGYVGHLRALPYREVQKKHPEIPLKLAVRRMLPKNELGRRMLRKLKIYPGPDHPHQAQTPQVLPL